MLPGEKVDFCSNDYLGFARSEQLREMILEKAPLPPKGGGYMDYKNGSGGSRLLAGNSKYAEDLEDFIAGYYSSEAALLFNSGYNANLGLFSCLPQRGDTIIYDELVHASIHDGMRLSNAISFPFRHNDIEHLKERLDRAPGNIFVAVESVYSMDGDFAPLNEIAQICEGMLSSALQGGNVRANLIVDEAHATGVFGKGMVQQYGIEKKIFAVIHTFGKALGVFGAAITGSQLLKDYLINYARCFIYSTALPPHCLMAIECAYTLLAQSDEAVNKLRGNIQFFRQNIKELGIDSHWIVSSSPIQCILIPGNEKVLQVAENVQANNMDVRAIRSPTVAKGKERIRICLHSFNSEEEIKELLEILSRELKK
jgi:8-amino-7-oxononanoate synthase